METGIFIRAKLDDKWCSVDIGDNRITDQEILTWLKSRGGHNPFAENCCLILLGRKAIAD